MDFEILFIFFISCQISPIEYAIETMELTNKAIRDLVIAHKNDETLPINPLSMKINGIVDPAVMGGFIKYEEAFLTPEYSEQHSHDEHLIEKLKELIATQIPLLEVAVNVHRAKAPASLLPFHERLEKCFAEMQINVESKYGKRVNTFLLLFFEILLNICFLFLNLQYSDLKFDRDSFVTMRKQGVMQQMSIDSNRLSETSMGSTE